MAYQNLDLYILETIAGVMAKHKQKYCVISQEKFLSLLREFYNISICKRTLNYHLRKLEDKGYIKRERRIRRKPNGTFYTLPTCYFFQEKTYHFFHQTYVILHRFFNRTTELQNSQNNYYLNYYDLNKVNTYREEGLKKGDNNFVKDQTNQPEYKTSKLSAEDRKPYEGKNNVLPELHSNTTKQNQGNLKRNANESKTFCDKTKKQNSDFSKRETQEEYIERLKRQFAVQREKRLRNLTTEKRRKINDILENKKVAADIEKRKEELLRQALYLKEIGFFRQTSDKNKPSKTIDNQGISHLNFN